MPKLCIKCGIEKEISHFNGARNVCYKCYGKRERAQLKLEMIESLGSSCQCCGESNPYFLSLDHIKNDGSQHRKDLNEQQIYRQARKEGWPKDKYQLLCMNCNFAKGHFQECPHKLNISADMALERLRDLASGIGIDHVVHNTANLPEARKALEVKRLEQTIEALKSGKLSHAQQYRILKRHGMV